jgi:hypothetical protein
MSRAKEIKFSLTGETFHEIDPAILISNLNILALVQRINQEQPAKVMIDFDGSREAINLLLSIAGEIGYFAKIETPTAVFERV